MFCRDKDFGCKNTKAMKEYSQAMWAAKVVSWPFLSGCACYFVFLFLFSTLRTMLVCLHSAHSFGLSRFGSARRIFPRRNLFSDSSPQVMSKVQMLLSVLGWCGLTAMGLAIVFQLDSSTPLVASVVLVASNALMALFFLGFVVLRTLPSKSQEPHLHWNPEIRRRGMGDLIRSVNHIAIIVADVGRSLAFYTEIIGFQQIQRPNFDRHGAWLTMGNLELHLIKGVPNAPTGRDLIVSHIALETEQPHKVLEKLLEFEVPFRQNISVPDPKKARENLVEAFENSEGKITQYFVRDPDGYYLEICNCDILTAFCLFKEKESARRKTGHIPKYMQLMDAVLGTYNESGQTKASVFQLPQLIKMKIIVRRWVKRARGELSTSFDERVKQALAGVEAAAEADPKLMANFVGRQKTYCDICQGFSKEDLASTLCTSGNHAPTALLLLAACRQDVKVFLPPQYLLSEGGRIQQQVMAVAALSRRNFGSRSTFASKPFEDAAPKGNRSSVASFASSFLPASLTDPGVAEKDSRPRNSGKMLALTFDNDPKMQDYLTKSYTFARRQVQVSDVEEGLVEMSF